MNARVCKMCMRVCVRVCVRICNTSDESSDPEVVHRETSGGGNERSDRRPVKTPVNAGERSSMLCQQ